jgi:hypothetical protein
MLLSIILGSMLVLSYGLFIAMSIVTVAQQPLFNSKQDNFDLRLFLGEDKVMLVRTHASIVWEEPDQIEHEGYFPAHNEIRVPTTLGYKVEHLV